MWPKLHQWGNSGLLLELLGMRNYFPTRSLKLDNCNKLWREVAWEWPQQRGKQSQETETLVLMAYFWHMILTIPEARLLIYFHFISLFLREFEWVSAPCNLRSIAVNILWFPTSMSLLSLFLPWRPFSHFSLTTFYPALKTHLKLHFLCVISPELSIKYNLSFMSSIA